MQYNENGQCSRVMADKCETRSCWLRLPAAQAHHVKRARAIALDLRRGIDPEIWEGWKLRVCYVYPCLRRRDSAGRWRSMAFGRAVAPHLGYADCQGRTGLAARGDRRHVRVGLPAVV